MVSKYNLVNASSSGSGGSETAETFTQLFNATTDWSGPSGGYYSITILQTTHAKSLVPIVQLYETSGSDFEQVDAEIIINSSGDVTVQVPDNIDSRFAGKIVIL